MNKDQVKGIIDEVAGTAKRKAGELTDNPKLQLEGAVQQLKGDVEKAWGNAKEAIHHPIDNTGAHLDASLALKTKSTTANVEYKK